MLFLSIIVKGCLADLPLFLPTEKLFESENYKLLIELLKNVQKIKHDLHDLEKNCVVMVSFCLEVLLVLFKLGHKWHGKSE